MFIITKEPFGNTIAYRLTNTVSQEYVQIVPSCGAIVNAFVLKTDHGFFNVIDGFNDDHDFINTNNTSFKSNFLFPFPNRIRGGKYSFANQTHQLNINFPQENNAIHGLVYDQNFVVLHSEAGSKGAKIVLMLSSEGFVGFPFRFELRITYVFSDEGITMESEVENKGDVEFPYGLGWHHYFKLGECIDTAVFSFPSIKILEVDKQMIPNGQEKTYEEFHMVKALGDTKLDNCFFLGDQGMITIALGEPSSNLRLSLSYDTRQFPYLQVYTPSHRKTIAVEPMTCAPDVFNNHKGIKTLKPKEKFSSTFTIQVLG